LGQPFAADVSYALARLRREFRNQYRSPRDRRIGVLFTTQFANIMPGAGATARLAYSTGTLAVLAFSGSLIGSFWLREPEGNQLPD
jgi:hypothetical protein